MRVHPTYALYSTKSSLDNASYRHLLVVCGYGLYHSLITYHLAILIYFSCNYPCFSDLLLCRHFLVAKFVIVKNPDGDMVIQ